MGLTLNWFPQTWPLDAILDDPQPVLDQYGFLPLDATPLTRNLKPAPRGTETALDTVSLTRESTTATYYGLFPRAQTEALADKLAHLSRAQLDGFRTALSLTILSGQKQLWIATQSAIAQTLSYRKRYHVSRALRRSIPRYRPYFVSFSKPTATFPPGRRIANLAEKWLPLGDPDEEPDEFHSWCIRHNVKHKRETLRLAILALLVESSPPPDRVIIPSPPPQLVHGDNPHHRMDRPPTPTPGAFLPTIFNDLPPKITSRGRELLSELRTGAVNKHIASLSPGTALSPTMLKNILAHMVAETPNPRPYLVNPSFFTAYLAVNALATDKKLAPVRSTIHSRSYTIFPFLIHDHWVLTVIYPTSPIGRVEIYNSIPGMGNRAIKRALRLFLCRRNAHCVLEGTEVDPISTWEIKVSPSPSQTPGSKDGGIYLILRVGDLLVPGSYPPSGSPNIDWTRHTLAGFFLDADRTNRTLMTKTPPRSRRR